MKTQKKEVKTVQQPPKTVMTSNQRRFYNNLIHNSYPIAILADNNLNALDRELLSIIFTMVNNTGQFFQSNDTLIKTLNVGKSTIIRSMKRLKKYRYITYGNFVRNGRLRRYITSINYHKLYVLNKRVSKHIKRTQSIVHKLAKNTNHKSKNKPLTKKQNQLINKAIKVISKHVPDYDTKHIRNTFISEYNNGKLNFNHMNEALIIYVYEKVIKNYPINSSAGFISSLTTKAYNKKQLRRMKFKINGIRNDNSNNNDGFDYGDDDPIYNKISTSPKLLKQYHNKYGVDFDSTKPKDINKLKKIFKINYYENKTDFMGYIQNLVDKGKLGDLPANDIKAHYLLNRDKINQYLKKHKKENANSK